MHNNRQLIGILLAHAFWRYAKSRGFRIIIVVAVCAALVRPAATQTITDFELGAAYCLGFQSEFWGQLQQMSQENPTDETLRSATNVLKKTVNRLRLYVFGRGLIDQNRMASIFLFIGRGRADAKLGMELGTDRRIADEQMVKCGEIERQLPF